MIVPIGFIKFDTYSVPYILRVNVSYILFQAHNYIEKEYILYNKLKI